MRSLLGSVASVAFVFMACTSASAQSSLGQTLKDISVAEHWIYDDLPRAIAEAKQSGKPLLVVLRCVPCPPGKTLDQAVMNPDDTLKALEQQFVCVRVIKATGLDLDVFQYDYDMSWNAMFLNAADMTIYGRYGTRYSNLPGTDSNLSAAAFAKAAKRVLALHKNYPANKAALAGKTGKPVEWKLPEDTPGLTDRRGVAVEKKNCIHCHMVKDFAMRAKWEQGRLSESDIFVYPAPAQVGLALDKDDGLIVESVAANSPAAEAGVKVGDVLATAGGQPLISTADFTWVLQVSPSETKLPLIVTRDGKSIDTALVLSGDWKKSDIGWRISTWWGLRQGIKFTPLPAEGKQSRGLAADAGALEVIGMWGKNMSVVQQAGLKKGDVIVEVDGRPAPQTETDFLVDLRMKHGPKDNVRFTIVRNGQRQELTVPLW